MKEIELKIEKIRVRVVLDPDPDLSFLGKYSDIYQEHAIDREVNPRELRYFIPTNPEYGNQDYKRMESYNNDWYMIGIIAKAEVSYCLNSVFKYKRIESFSSGGLWGIESDSGKDHLNEVKKEELEDLKDHLEHFGVDITNFDKLAKNLEIDFD